MLGASGCMTALPLTWLLALNAGLLLLAYFSQRAWFAATRAWWRRRGLPRPLHSALFFLLLLASAWVMASHAYHRPALLRILYGWSAVYLVSSSASGFLLLIGRGFQRRPAAPNTPHRRNEPGAEPAAAPRRRFLRWAGTAALAAPWAASGYGYTIERGDVQLTQISLHLGAAARPWSGLTIALISDIHLDDYFSARRLAAVVERINRLRPDLIAITGDFITYRHSIPDLVRILAPLRARLGKFASLGNHETSEHAQRILALACARIGIDVLRFASRRLRAGGGRLNLIGVDFLQSGQEADVRSIGGYARAGELNILLSHNPNVFPYLDPLPIQLTLAGHLHGGQLVIPGLAEISPARLISPYLAGLYRRGGHWMYVNRGLGTVGVPIRFGARPEITRLELV